MTLSYIIFTASLLVLLGFVLFKQRELSRGTVSGMTRVLAAHSPEAEMKYDAFVARLRAFALRARNKAWALLMRVWHAVRMFVRHIVVLLAAKMVKAVRGEKLMYGNGAPSLYLKRLGAEMQNGNDLSPEDVQEDVVRRVEVTEASSVNKNPVVE